MPNLLALFDVLAVPSEWEAFGIVNLEAMASAKPVVAFDTDGIPEAIVHGETGLLVPHRDSRALASAIAQLLDDALLRRRMGAAGRQKVEQRFDVRRMTQKLESFYENVTYEAPNLPS
jgi:glycosyltransferase involved in cell wall biosynthesis